LDFLGKIHRGRTKLHFWELNWGKYLCLGEKQCVSQVDRRVAEHDTIIYWQGGGLGARAINESNVHGRISKKNDYK